MAVMKFRKARRKQVHLRVFLLAKSGDGKTMTALQTALHLAEEMGLPASAVGLIDSEVTPGDDAKEAQGSGEKYEGEPCRCAQCMGQGLRIEGFQVLLLPPGMQSPDDYCMAIAAAKAAGVVILVIDSISHEWEAAKNLVDRIKAQSNRNAFTAWGDVTPLHERFVHSILAYPGHVICTMRGKEKFEPTEDRKIRSLGVLPVQRPMIEYEFDLGLFLSNEGSQAAFCKSRSATLSGRHYDRPGKQLAVDMLAWSTRGDADKERNEAKESEAKAFQHLDVSELHRQIDGVRATAGHALAKTIRDYQDRSNDREHLGKLLAWAKREVAASNEGEEPDPTQGSGQPRNNTTSRTGSATRTTDQAQEFVNEPVGQGGNGGLPQPESMNGAADQSFHGGNEFDGFSDPV